MGKLFLVMFLFLCFLPQGEAQSDVLLAGVAVADICPPVGVPLAGYGGGKRRLDFPDLDPDNYNVLLAPSEGILDPLMAKALVLQSETGKIAILKIDSVGVMEHMVRDVVKKIQPLTGIDEAHFTMVGTHSHSGPGAMCKGKFWEIAAVDLFDKRIYDPMIEKLAQVVIDANSRLEPARLGVDTTTATDLSRNRRDHPGVFDPTIAVFKITRLDGSPMAVMFNFAVHGTCLGTSNLKMSADVMGFAERRVEEMLPETCAIFVNGSQGDVAPARGGYDGAKEVGEALANKVLGLVPGIATDDRMTIAVADIRIAFSKAQLNLELRNERADSGELDLLRMRTFFPFMRSTLPLDITGMVPSDFRLQVIRLGDIAIACVPGEPLTAVGEMIKNAGSQAGFRQTFVFGLANGHMGYLCDKANFDEGGYEVMMNIYGRDAADRVVQGLTGLLGSVR